MYNAFRSAALLLAIVLLSGCNPQPESDGKIILNGNVDDREVNAAFLVSERIAAVHVEEGAAVKKGDLLAELETIRIENRIAEAQAAVDSARTNVMAADAAIEAAQAALDKAVNGNRKEDIDLARAGVEVFDAQIHAAENLYERNKKLSSEEGVRAVSQQDLDNAESNFKKLVAERKLAQTNLEKMLAGSRKYCRGESGSRTGEGAEGNGACFHRSSPGDAGNSKANSGGQQTFSAVRRRGSKSHSGTRRNGFTSDFCVYYCCYKSQMGARIFERNAFGKSQNLRQGNDSR